MVAVRTEDASQATSNGVAVACRGVVKEFSAGDSSVRVLHGIDLELPAGELALLVGPSGCGKTTLISIIAGLLDATEGVVDVFGTPFSSLRGGSKVNYRGRNIGFVFQQYNLLPSLTAAENAAIPLIILGESRRRAIQTARETLALVGLADKADAMPNQLSGGQQQRVAIARALVHAPRLLVCDEPTAALDAASGRVVMELIRRVAVQPHRAVIVVTHDSRVFGFGDRMIMMADGMIERVTRNVQAEEVDYAT